MGDVTQGEPTNGGPIPPEYRDLLWREYYRELAKRMVEDTRRCAYCDRLMPGASNRKRYCDQSCGKMGRRRERKSLPAKFSHVSKLP